MSNKKLALEFAVTIGNSSQAVSANDIGSVDEVINAAKKIENYLNEGLTLEKVKNTDRKFGSNLDYYRLVADGKTYLFTEDDLKTAEQRAIDNPEDC